MTALIVTAFLDVLLFEQLSVLFDAVFVALCVAAALMVRPRDFFVVGVLPPLMMLGAVLLLALTVRESVAEAGDGLVQAVVSGLAHHAGALVTGYVLTLVVLALRQMASRHTGAIRKGASRSGTTLPTPPKARAPRPPRVPRQREGSSDQETARSRAVS